MRRAVLGAVAVLLLVAVLLMLTGCGGGDPKADPSPSPSPSSPVTSPVNTTRSAPVMPEAAKAETKAGAIAFVNHYFDLINFAQRTGSLDELAASESEACGSCSSGRNLLASIYGSGGHIEGGDLRVKVARALSNASIGGWTVEAQLTYGPQTVVRPTSTPSIEHLKGGGNLVSVQVSHRSGQWTVVDWTRAQ